MAGFSVCDQAFLDSDHPLLDFMDSLLGVEMTTGTGTGTGTGAPPSNLWSEPDSNIWPASNSSHDLFHILQNNNDMPVLETRSCIESFPQNKLTIKDEIPLNLPFNTPSFVFQHSPEILPTPINKTLGRSNTNPGGRAKRKKDHAHVTLHNFTSKQSSKESEENKCKRFRSSKYPVVGSESLELDDSKRSEAELPSKVVKKEPKFDSCKDYIHVRARRGQATDSHSLAERVRREKIRERMKRLHELVPGCNKVTGKAQMLDEIINYVQSMQSQVEFLSLKLTSVLSLCSVGLEIDSSRHEEQFQQILPLERTLTAYERDQAESQMPAVSKLY